MTEAYSVLSDPEKKKMYDQFGFAAFDQELARITASRAVEIRTAVRMETRSAEAETTAAITNFTLKETRTICSAISLIRCFHGKSRGSGSERYTRSGSSRHPFEDAFSGRGTAEDLDLHAEVSIRLEEAASAVKNRLPCGTRMERPIRCWLKSRPVSRTERASVCAAKGHTGSNGRRGDLL